MPELPEVEILKNQLKPKVINRIFDNIIVRKTTLRQVITEDFSKKLESKQIINLERRAKYIIFKLSDRINLIMHLGMTGKLIFKDIDYIPDKHDHIIFNFKDKENILVYNDARRFGLAKLIKLEEIESDILFKYLGPEPLTEDFNIGYLLSKLKNKKMNIKNSLMDNSIVVGIGNIYANEILFKSGVLPFRPSFEVTKEEAELIVKNSKLILEKSINLGGSSFKNYVHADETKGNFQNEFQVYNQEGKNCIICNAIIIRTRIGGRSTFYCPNCQK